MSSTRKVIRHEVGELLAGGRSVSSTITTAGTNTGADLIDTTLKSTLLDNYPFTGDTIRLTSGACVDQWKRVASYVATSGTFTLDDPFVFTATGTGVTITATTLTDARQAWEVNSFKDYVITCDEKTMTVTSNTATVLTGAAWAASDPSAGKSYACVGSTAVGVTYEIYSVLHPDRIESSIDRALRKMDYETLALPSLMADADMEASGTTSYSSGTGVTLAKDTTAANVFRQAQSLSVTADATGGDDEDAYGYQTFLGVERDTYLVWAVARNSAAATTCKLSAHDATADAVIKSKTSGEIAYQILAFQFELPADCEQFQIRLQTMTNSGVSYWDQVQLLRIRQRRYALPSWVVDRRQVMRTVYQPQGAELVAGYGRMPDECLGKRWHMYVEQEGNTVYVKPDPNFRQGLIFIRCLRPYAALSSDTDTTTADLDWVVAKTLFECYDLLDSPQTPADERALFAREKDKWALRAAGLDAKFMPQPPTPFGFGEEELFRLND